MSENCEKNQSPQKVVVFRHGERVDFIFGYEWYYKAFQNGKYVRSDCNMPEKLQERKLNDWMNDTPLTRIGMYQSKLVGDSLKCNGIKFDHALSSPSYRCVQTCDGILKGTYVDQISNLFYESSSLPEMGCDSTIPIKIEPGLFDWFAWSNGHWPVWCSDQELSSHFNIDSNYKSVMSRESLNEFRHENLEEYYNRSYNAMKKLLNEYRE